MASGLRAQAGTEYLMTYGWALLAVVVIGVAAWQLGILNADVSSITFKGFSKLKPQLAGTGMSNIGDFKGTFTNGMGSRVIVRAVRVKDLGKNGATICCSHPGADGAATGCDSYSGTVNIGGRTMAEFTAGTFARVNSGDNFILQLMGCSISGRKGKPYNIQVEIDYESTEGKLSVPHTDSGTIRGPFE
jgi:hypothetical protein